MATKLKQIQARREALNRLGRPLARRARSSCELCTESNRALSAYEVAPVPDEPELDRTLFLCEHCHAGADGGKLETDRWRFLETAVWAELPASQVVAVRLLRRIADNDVAWARDANDQLYLDPAIIEWIES